MPVYRFTDSLGSCAQNISILYGTEYGEYGYDCYCEDTYGHAYTISESFEMTDIQQAQPTGVWDGMAGTFSLPITIRTDNFSMVYSDFYALIEFEALVSNPTTMSNFNTAACYCHKILLPALDLSISIGYQDTSLGIGIGFGPSYENRTAGMLVKYYPD